MDNQSNDDKWCHICHQKAEAQGTILGCIRTVP